jgi:hypothetical protein
VPGIGPVSVPEDRYSALYDLLASENPDDWERAYTALERIQRETPAASIVVHNAPQNSGPTNMLPAGFRATPSAAIPDDNARDLAEPSTVNLAERLFDKPPTRAERLW